MKIGELMSLAWEKFKAGIVPLILSVFLLYLILLPISVINTQVAQDQNAVIILSPVLSLLYIVFSAFILTGITHISLLAADGEPVRVSDAFARWNLMPKMLGAMILVSLFCLAGTVLLVIPGIYVYYRTSMFPFFLVDKNCGPVKGLKLSWRATKGHVLKLMLIDLIVFLLVFAGLLCFIVGMLPAAMYANVMRACYYRYLEGEMAEEVVA